MEYEELGIKGETTDTFTVLPYKVTRIEELWIKIGTQEWRKTKRNERITVKANTPIEIAIVPHFSRITDFSIWFICDGISDRKDSYFDDPRYICRPAYGWALRSKFKLSKNATLRAYIGVRYGKPEDQWILYFTVKPTEPSKLTVTIDKISPSAGRPGDRFTVYYTAILDIPSPREETGIARVELRDPVTGEWHKAGEKTITWRTGEKVKKDSVSCIVPAINPGTAKVKLIVTYGRLKTEKEAEYVVQKPTFIDRITDFALSFAVIGGIGAGIYALYRYIKKKKK